MGASSTKVENIARTFNDNLTENLKNTLIKKSTELGAVMKGDQVMDFSGADFRLCDNVSISNLSQKIVTKYNFQILQSNIDQAEFKEMMKSNIEKSVEQDTDTKREFGSTGKTNQTTVTETMNKNVNRLVQNMDYSDFTSAMTSMKNRQEISFRGFKAGRGTCNVNNIKQDIVMELAAQLLSEKVTKEVRDMLTENMEKNELKGSTSDQSTGFIGDLGRGISNINSSIFGGIAQIGSVLTSPIYVIGIVILFIIVAYIISSAMSSGSIEGKFNEDGSYVSAMSGTVPPQQQPQQQLQQMQPQQQPQQLPQQMQPQQRPQQQPGVTFVNTPATAVPQGFIPQAPPQPGSSSGTLQLSTGGSLNAF